MGNNSHKPAIRFQGFTDAWEQRKLGELVKIGDIDHRMPPTTDDGVPYLMTGDFCGVNELNFDGVKHVSREDYDILSRKIKPELGDILFARYASVGAVRYVDFTRDFLISYSCAIIKKGEKIDSKFLYHFLSSDIAQKQIQLEINTGSQANIGIDSMKNNIFVFMPSKAEQIKISKYLSDMDTLITLHQRKYEKLKTVKKSMLEKMFPRDGSNNPEIRFIGFTDPWEQHKLSEVLTSYTDPVDIPHTGYERLGIRSHAKGTFHSYVPEGHELQTAQMHKVAANKFIVNITFGWEHAVAVTDENDAGKLVSHRFPQFSLSEDLDPKFLKYIILDENFRHHLWLASPGGAGRNRVLNLTEMLQYEICIPNLSEQRQIADVLIRLDNLITLHHLKLEKLKNIKQSLLQNMFV